MTRIITSAVALTLLVSLAVAGSRTIPTETSKVTEWSVSVTNSTDTLTNTSGQPRKLNRIYYDHASAVTGTGTVSIVKGTSTNALPSKALAATASGQTEFEPPVWQFPGDTLIVGDNNTTTTKCDIVVEYEHP